MLILQPFVLFKVGFCIYFFILIINLKNTHSFFFGNHTVQ